MNSIEIKMTAAQAPFSNGIVERFGKIIKEMLEKVQRPPWNNTLSNNKGYSPNQLVMGQNPRLQSNLEDQESACGGRPGEK